MLVLVNCPSQLFYLGILIDIDFYFYALEDLQDLELKFSSYLFYVVCYSAISTATFLRFSLLEERRNFYSNL